MRCLPVHSIVRNKIPLADQATSGNVRPQQKAVRGAKHGSGDPGGRRANINTVTEVRCCGQGSDGGDVHSSAR